MLGDVFESVMGAIFLDGGMEEVIKVYRNIIGPFILFIAKFSKSLYKEPKEEFIITSTTKYRMKP